MSKNRLFSLACTAGLLAALTCAVTLAQTYKPFPGGEVDQRTRAMQERVDELFIAGDFDRAILIYEKDLAPLGDKYAQYMVGFMHLNAQGVSRDRIEAFAWYRLASERGEPLLVEARDRLLALLSISEVSASDVRFLELWKTISDRRLILGLIESDLGILKQQTGTRISGSRVNRPNLIVRRSGESLSPNFYVDVDRRVAARMRYLNSRVDIIDQVLADELQKSRLQETSLRAELAALQDR